MFLDLPHRAFLELCMNTTTTLGLKAFSFILKVLRMRTRIVTLREIVTLSELLNHFTAFSWATGHVYSTFILYLSNWLEFHMRFLHPLLVDLLISTLIFLRDLCSWFISFFLDDLTIAVDLNKYMSLLSRVPTHYGFALNGGLIVRDQIEGNILKELAFFLSP